MCLAFRDGIDWSRKLLKWSNSTKLKMHAPMFSLLCSTVPEQKKGKHTKLHCNSVVLQESLSISSLPRLAHVHRDTTRSHSYIVWKTTWTQPSIFNPDHGISGVCCSFPHHEWPSHSKMAKPRELPSEFWAGQRPDFRCEHSCSSKYHVKRGHPCNGM